MLGMDDSRQGIVHIIGPEQGFTLPGTTIVCGDSHTATHGAFGALAFGLWVVRITNLSVILSTTTANYYYYYHHEYYYYYYHYYRHHHQYYY